MDNGNHSFEQGKSESDFLDKSKSQHRERAPRESHSCMDPRRLAIVRARDALRKRRWREKRKLELSQKIVNEEEKSQQNECESSKLRIELETIEVIPKSENSFLDSLPEKNSSKRAGISPEKLREMRAKDAERKRKARMRKRLISAGVSDGESMSLLMGKNNLLQSEASQQERIQKEELEQIGEIALAQLSIDVNDGNGEPSTASDSGLSSILSPSSAFSPVFANHTPKGCSRMPRKLLTPNQLLEVRSKDNARKREQRSRKKIEQQQDMAKNIIHMMNGANEVFTTPAFNALAVNSILKMNPQCVLNPLLGSGGLGGCLPPSIPSFPLISGSSLLCAPGLPFSTALNVDTDLAISTSAPASLLENRSDQDPIELFRSLVEKVSQRQFSPRVQSEERAAAKRAARAARIARMTEQQKDMLRASDRERKRLWRQRKRELQGGSSLSESAHPSSSSNQ